MKEIWKDILGYEGYYQVSNKGDVRGLDRSVNHWRGGKRRVRGEIISPCFHKNKYICYRLTKNGERKIITGHRLVAIAFIPNPENKPEINHIDGNKKNNNVNNLEWCTHKQNQEHATKLGLIKSGVDNPNSKLTKEEAVKVINLINDTNLVDREISEITKASRKIVNNIRNGKSYKKLKKRVEAL